MIKFLAILIVLLVILIYFIPEVDTETFDNLLPTNGFELKYSSFKWNIPPMISGHNCYDYAFNNYNLLQRHTSQPGDLPNAIADNLGNNYSCPLVKSRLVSDHINTSAGVDIKVSSRNETCPNNFYKIALVMDPSDDYHFIRQNSDGTWSHKPGKGRVTNKDFSGNIITDPEISDMNGGRYNYEHFCGYFCISTDANDNFDES